MGHADRLPNTQSTARDHLANERTFLSWVRTGLGVVGLGLILQKVAVDQPGSEDRHLALSLLLGGAGLIAYGTLRYYRVNAALRQGEFVLARRSPVAVGVVTVLFVLLLALWEYVRRFVHGPT